MSDLKRRIAFVAGLAAPTLAVVANAQSVDLSNRYSTSFQTANRPDWITIGSVKLRGYTKVDYGVEDNVFGDDADEVEDTFVRAKAVASAWIGNRSSALNVSVGGQVKRYDERSDADTDYVYARIYGRTTLPYDTQLEGVVDYQTVTKARDDERRFYNLAEQPRDETFGSSLYLTKGIDELALTARADVTRRTHEDAATNGGPIFERSDRNHIQYDGRLRGSWLFGETDSVFLEGGYTHWVFDDDFDRNGIARGTEGGHAALGVYLQPNDKLRGEAAIGYRVHSFADAQFSDLHALTFDAWGVWAPNAKFNLKGWASTDFYEDTLWGRAGVLSRSAALQADYYLTPRARVFSRGGFYFDDNLGAAANDETWTGAAGLDFEITPGILSSFEYRYRDFDDGDDFRTHEENGVFVSLTLDR